MSICIPVHVDYMLVYFVISLSLSISFPLSLSLIRNQFKAHPIPPHLFKGSEQCTGGVPQVSTLNKIPLTTPVSPNITKPAASKRDYWDEEKEQQPQEKKFKVIIMYMYINYTHIVL